MAVIAAGAWSRPLCRLLGDDVPLDTERGYNLTLPKGSLGLSRMILFEGEGFVTTPLDIGDRLGGAVEFGGLSLPPNYKRVDAMIGRARRFLPDASFEGGTRWMGFRPSLPDTLPVISSASSCDRIIYAFGHAHHGLTQSALTGEIVGALVSRQAAPAGYRAVRRAAVQNVKVLVRNVTRAPARPDAAAGTPTASAQPTFETGG